MPIAVRVLGIVALATLATRVLGEDDFPIVGTYTENTPCTGDGSDVSRVTITAHDIDSVFGFCTILSRKREGATFAVHLECKGPNGRPPRPEQQAYSRLTSTPTLHRLQSRTLVPTASV